jgi:hypothetical protein
MIGAKIDIYHDEIAQAIHDNDTDRLAQIAQCFYERHRWYRPWSILDAEFCVVQHSGPVVSLLIQFDGGDTANLTVGYQGDKQKVSINGQDIHATRMDQVVEILGVPMAFIDGLYFAASCAITSEQCSIGKLAMTRAQLEEGVSNLKWKFDELKDEIAEREQQLSLIGDRADPLPVSRVDYSRAEEIARLYATVPADEFCTLEYARTRFAGKSGIYFGWSIASGKCVYVGKSKNCGNRISPSRHELRGCQVTVLEMPEADIHLWELFYIWLMRPERNGQVVESSRDKECVTNGR